MPLLAEYAITPDVFDPTSYSTEEVCGLHLRTIREVLMEEGLVRDLRAGEWRKLLAEHDRPWHRWAKEIVKKLAVQGRLIEFPPALSAMPANDSEWCAEALATHERNAMLGGVIVTNNVKDRYPDERVVERIDRLSVAPWWAGRSPSVRLNRRLADYREHLGPILRSGNSLQFIDPHLDPERQGYKPFADLLAEAGRRTPAPLVEIHRSCPEDTHRTRRNLEYIEQVFREQLAQPLRAAGLEAEVFIWEKFHDRYFLSNLIGISVPYGFDVSGKPDDPTTWTRLGRATLDDIQREFDEASGRRELLARFSLP